MAGDKDKEEVVKDGSLENPSTIPESDSEALEEGSKAATAAQAAQEAHDAAPAKINWRERIIRRLGSINPYLVLFVIILLLGIIIAFIANRLNSQNDPGSLTFKSGELDQEALDKLLQAEQNIGTVDQTLTVAANAIFNGKVLVKSDLDVAGSIRVGGPLNLPGITVAGASEFEDVNVSNNLTILGSATIQKTLSIQDSLNVSGNASVGGTLSAAKISAESFEFTGDLNLVRHIDTGGGTPAASAQAGVGSGGTVSVSGNDIAGTVTINTGGSPPSGIMVRINFNQAYNNTPVVQITPINAASAALEYYVTRDTNGFSIGSAGTPAGATTYKFDYFIVE